MARCYKSYFVWCAVFLVYVTLILYLCYILPFSQLYRTLHNYDSLFAKVEAYTEAHSRESLEYLEYFKLLDPLQSSQFYQRRLEEGNIQFAIGIVSFKRKTKESGAETTQSQQTHSAGYLLHTMSAVDQVIKQSPYLRRAVPFICNVQLNPSEHEDAISLYPYLPYTERYGNNTLNVPAFFVPNSKRRFKNWEKHVSKYKKETVDYSFCLMTAAYLKPKYVILLEDDTVPHRDFPTVLEHLLESRLAHHSNYAYLKLYFPPKWQGFQFDISTNVDLLFWSFIMAATTYTCYLIFNKCNIPFTHKVFQIDLSDHILSFSHKIRIPCSGRLFLVLFTFSLLSCWLLGRQNLESIRRLWRYFYRLQAAEGCCTQAQLYPIDVIGNLSEYLVNVEDSRHTDLAISDFAAENSLPTWQVEPNLFFHCGLHTSLSSRQKHPEEFAFNL